MKMKAPKLSDRIKSTPEPWVHGIRERVMARQKANEKVYDLSQATVALAPPLSALKAISGDVEDDPVNNALFPETIRGLLDLRRSLAKRRSSAFVGEIDASNIVVTGGANHAFDGIVKTVFDHDDKVVVPSPYFFNQVMSLKILGAQVKEVPGSEETGFQVDCDKVEAFLKEGAQGIVLVNPNNPTGRVLSIEDITKLNNLCRMYSSWMIIDETYYALSEECESAALGRLDLEHTILLGSFSKSLGLAAWRVGYVIARPDVIEQLLKAQDSSLICAGKRSQEAANAALRTSVSHCKKTQKMLLARAKIAKQIFLSSSDGEIPLVLIDCPPFVFFKVQKFQPGVFRADEFCARLLERTGIALLPGSIFGSNFDSWIRMCIGTCSNEELKTICKSIVSFLREP